MQHLVAAVKQDNPMRYTSDFSNTTDWSYLAGMYTNYGMFTMRTAATWANLSMQAMDKEKT